MKPQMKTDNKSDCHGLRPRNDTSRCCHCGSLRLSLRVKLRGIAEANQEQIPRCARNRLRNLARDRLREAISKRRNPCILNLLVAISLFATFLAGCATEYNPVTRQEEMIVISTDKEVRMGTSISKQVEKRFKVVKDERVQQRVEDIGKKLEKVCERKDIIYHFKVLDEKELNAMALPGGFVYVNQGLIDRVENDDELAGVIGHEIGHIVAKHSVKKIQGVMSYNLLRILMGVGGAEGDVVTGADYAVSQLLLAYSREDELLADKLGVRYSRDAGYDPAAMLTFLDKLREYERKQPLRQFSYFRTHPYISDRMRVVRQEVYGRIDVDDYINREE